MNRLCRWSPDPDGFWETKCGELFEFTAEGPTENGFHFCPYCGGGLVVLPKRRSPKLHRLNRAATA